MKTESKVAIGAALEKAKKMTPQEMLCKAQLTILACAAAPTDESADARALEAAGYLIAYAESDPPEVIVSTDGCLRFEESGKGCGDVCRICGISRSEHRR